MYENIGKKIKALASTVFAIDFCAGVIAGIAFLAEGRDRYTVLGIVFLLGGPLVGYIFSLLIYGFGELICKATEIENNTRGTSFNNENDSTNETDDNTIEKKSSVYDFAVSRIERGIDVSRQEYVKDTMEKTDYDDNNSEYGDNKKNEIAEKQAKRIRITVFAFCLVFLFFVVAAVILSK